MNVIFLDFDGVIDTNYYKSYEQVEEKVKILSYICHEYDCKVVIEASAKDAINEETLEVDKEATWVLKIFELFKKYDIECIGRTPNVSKPNNDISEFPMWKEDEIILYLYRHPEIDHFCVIDDDDLTDTHKKSDLDKVRDHLVKTNDFLMDNPKDEGLQFYHKEKIGDILKLENNFKIQSLRKTIS